jgi:3-deoxy-D-manno-octulosonic-acid transferase
VRHLLVRRIQRGKEDRHRYREKLGHIPPQAENFKRINTGKELIWLRVASVGEAASVISLIQDILEQKPTTAVIITSDTVTSARVIANKLRDQIIDHRVIHQYSPLDIANAYAKFIDFWQPKRVLFVESELWFNTLHYLQQQGIETFLINARISPTSYDRWLKFPHFCGKILACFTKIAVQDQLQQQYFSQLSKRDDVAIMPNLKYDIIQPKVSDRVLSAWQQQLAGKVVIAVANTHPLEEKFLLPIIEKLKQRYGQEVFFLIIPRHPARGVEVHQLILSSNDMCGRLRSQYHQPDMTQDDYYLADTIGEMSLWFSLADIVLMGGAWQPLGGHNIIEPACHDCAVISGSHTFNCQTIMDEFVSENAVIIADNQDAIYNHVCDLLNDADQQLAFKTAARLLAENFRGRGTDYVIKQMLL